MVEVQKEVAALVLRRFHEEWGKMPGFADTATIAEARHRAVAPVFTGALRAMVDFSWATAPFNSTPSQLIEHVGGNLGLICREVTEAGPPAEFWRHVRAELEKKPG